MPDSYNIAQIPKGTTLQKVYEQLPKQLQNILQMIHFPDDNGEHLLKALLAMN